MSDQKEQSDSQPLTIEDIQMQAVQLDAPRLRALIEGLRALPNVSDMAIINTIAELDRLASPIEQNERTRQRLIGMAVKIAEQRKLPLVVSLIRSTGVIPNDIMSAVIDSIIGPESDRPVHPTCDCPRCSAARQQAAQQGGSATTH